MAFADPQNNLTELALQAGERVADLGSGVGSLSLAAARAVGPDGKVYAVDVQKELLQRLKDNAKREGLGNVEVVWGDFERQGGSGLKDHAVDVVILSNVLFQAKSTYTVALEAKRILRPTGRLMIIEWSDSFGGIGPHVDDVTTKEKVLNAFAEAGFKMEKEFSAGDHHYGLILKK